MTYTPEVSAIGWALMALFLLVIGAILYRAGKDISGANTEDPKPDDPTLTP